MVVMVVFVLRTRAELRLGDHGRPEAETRVDHEEQQEEAGHGAEDDADDDARVEGGVERAVGRGDDDGCGAVLARGEDGGGMVGEGGRGW